MHSVFKKLPDLSYRSHRSATVGADSGSAGNFEPFDIRPPYLDRGFMDSSKWTMSSSTTGLTTTTFSSSRTISPSSNHSGVDLTSVTGVTGIPNLVELDDAFNTLDPGQLLRESAAAATRAALMSELPSSRTSRQKESLVIERQSSHLVDHLLQQIYRRNEDDDINDDHQTFDDSLGPAGACFSPKCADPLKRKGSWELEVMRDHLRDALTRVTASLIQQLTQRDRLLLERERHCDVITAILQAASPKRSQDTKMRFSIEPPSSSSVNSSPQQPPNQPSDSSGFQQWHDAMRMVARLPGGVPPEFRRKLWLTLAEQHLLRIGVDWSDVERNCFNDRINPDDEDLGAQIVRDLHRTGCSLFCGDDALPNQALLKRVLLAYARWNKAVGYCQGLNVLAALLLEVMNRSEVESLKVMIYLIEGVLPAGYFANNLRGLSIDMAVFRDLLRQRLPALSRHLEMLQQSESSSGSSSYCIEPPLTNVFTMQWFLTLFATCLPKAAVLRVWDLIFLEGNDVLLRTALAIWQTLAERILTVRTCDDFYSIMAVLAREMLEFGLMEPNHLVQTIVSMAPFPFPGLTELRDKYRYNITPWSGGSGRVRLFYSDDDPEADEDEDDEKTKAMNAVATVFGGLMTSSALFRHTGRRISDITFRKSSHQSSSTSSSSSSSHSSSSNNEKEKLQLDIAALRKQYAKLRERQKQAHVMFWTVATSSGRRGSVDSASRSTSASNILSSSTSSSGINPVSHLLAGRKPLLTRRPSSSSSSPSSSQQSGGPKLKLPPPRVPPPATEDNKHQEAYFSAPTTPSDKNCNEAASSFAGGNAKLGTTTYPSKGPKQPRPVQQQRRNSGSSTTDSSDIRHQLYPAAVQPATSTTSGRTTSMTANRSRLVQELLEQNSAMLQKLKDRSEVAIVPSSVSSDDVNDDRQQSSWNNHHHPFPRHHVRPPNDVTVKLGLYNSPQKY